MLIWNRRIKVVAESKNVKNRRRKRFRLVRERCCQNNLPVRQERIAERKRYIVLEHSFPVKDRAMHQEMSAKSRYL